MQDSATARVKPLLAQQAHDHRLHRLFALAVHERAQAPADRRADLGELRVGQRGARRARDRTQVVVGEGGAEAERSRRPTPRCPSARRRGSTRPCRTCAAASRARPGPPPRRAAMRGSTCSRSMRSSSRGTPGMQKKSARPCSSRKPGAVPIGFGSTSAPSGNHACCALFSDISRPTLRKNARIVSSTAGSSRCARPKACASTAEVRSSRVGPRPPDTSTMSLRSRRALERVDHVRRIVAHRGVVVRLDVEAEQLLGEERLVGVDDLAAQQLVADREDLRLHRDTASRRAASTSAAKHAGDDIVEHHACASREAPLRPAHGPRLPDIEHPERDESGHEPERRAQGRRIAEQRREGEQLPHHLIDHDPAVVLAAEGALRFVRRPDAHGQQRGERRRIEARPTGGQRQRQRHAQRRAPGARGDRPIAGPGARGEEDRHAQRGSGRLAVGGFDDTSRGTAGSRGFGCDRGGGLPRRFRRHGGGSRASIGRLLSRSAGSQRIPGEKNEKVAAEAAGFPRV